MNTAPLEQIIQTSGYFFDDGKYDNLTLIVEEGVSLQYCFFTERSGTAFKRHIILKKDATYIASALFIATNTMEIIAEACGDRVRAELRLFALAFEDVAISIEGVARIEGRYTDVFLRVDQNNILLGNKVKVRGVPRLEIATNGVEGGHSCRIHRISGEHLFYLHTRGLNRNDAEALLIQSEVFRHLETAEKQYQEVVSQIIFQTIEQKHLIQIEGT